MSPYQRDPQDGSEGSTPLNRTTLKRAVAPALRSAATIGIGLLDFCVPKARAVFLAGSPPSEGNVAEIGRLLAARTDADIYWVDAPEESYLRALGIDPTRVQRLGGVWRPRTVVAYLRSTVVFVTHGVYDAPPWPPRKVVVNLWHGEQAKGGGLFMPRRRLKSPTSKYLTGSSSELADIKCRLALVTRDRHLLTGNPRTDQLFRPATPAQLQSLSVDPALPFVVWMPTFRRARTADGALAWTNTSDADADMLLADSLAKGVGRLHRQGVQVVVKPHPLDYTSRDMDNATTVTDDDLRDAQVPLYSLLGASSGLISDYSSVWIDYLIHPAPIAFYTPDSGSFEEGRGCPPLSFQTVLPNRELRTESDFDRFAGEVSSPSESYRRERRAAIQRLGLRVSDSVAEDVWNMLTVREPSLNEWTKQTGVRMGKGEAN